MRRSDHRRGFFNGRNLCLDIVTSDGTLVGTTGFREVENIKMKMNLVAGEGDEEAGPVERGHSRVGSYHTQVQPLKFFFYFDQ